MKRFLLATWLLVAVSNVARADDFAYQWPWIYSHIMSNTAASQGGVWASNQVVLIRLWPTNAWNLEVANGLTNGAVTGGLLTYTRTGKTFTIGLTPAAVQSIAGSGAHPSVGIWAQSGPGELAMLPNVLQVDAAGYWQMNASYQVVLSTNRWNDRWWTTNALGAVIMRNIP